MAGNLFGKMAADTLGLSDIGKIISPKDFDKVDGDDYIMNEDGEKIYFVIKSKSDEYVFTNRGYFFVLVDVLLLCYLFGLRSMLFGWLCCTRTLLCCVVLLVGLLHAVCLFASS